MIVAKQMDIRDNIKNFFDIAFNGEVVFVPRIGNKNVYIISQGEYEDLQKAKRNEEYLAMLDRSFAQVKNGETVALSIDELRSYE